MLEQARHKLLRVYVYITAYCYYSSDTNSLPKITVSGAYKYVKAWRLCDHYNTQTANKQDTRMTCHEEITIGE